MPDVELNFDKDFDLKDTPEDMFIKTGDDHADDYSAFVESKGTEISDTAESPQVAPRAALPRWRNAKSLLKLKEQINERYPRRSKISDGHIGDDRHCPNPNHTGNSDHCLNIIDGNRRVVTAMDITHDPVNCDVDAVVEAIRESKDSRIKYIIWNKRICHFLSMDGRQPWEWRPYTGSNDHTKHAHFSVRPEKPRYDDVTDWKIDSPAQPSAGV